MRSVYNRQWCGLLSRSQQLQGTLLKPSHRLQREASLVLGALSWH